MIGWDAIVAGAGPAGAVAAHVLSRTGCRVLLCDTVRTNPAKIGEALPGMAVHLLRSLDLPAPDQGGRHRRIRGNWSAWGSTNLVATDFLMDPSGPHWRLDRTAFDASLREGAIRSGACFKDSRIKTVERAGRFWRVRFSDDELTKSAWLIDATGRGAMLARQIGAKRTFDPRLVALCAFGQPESGIEFDRTVVEAGTNGWWYAAWLPSGIPVAAWHLDPRDARQVLGAAGSWRRAFEQTRHVSTKMPQAIFDGKPHAIEAGGARLDRFAGDGWLACGDAALCFDPLSGRGILSAIETGRMAGEALAAGRQSRASKLEAYTDRLEKIRRTYAVEQWRLYSAERRWATERFWAKRRSLMI